MFSFYIIPVHLASFECGTICITLVRHNMAGIARFCQMYEIAISAMHERFEIANSYISQFRVISATLSRAVVSENVSTHCCSNDNIKCTVNRNFTLPFHTGAECHSITEISFTSIKFEEITIYVKSTRNTKKLSVSKHCSDTALYCIFPSSERP